jgi:hypothetical protein
MAARVYHPILDGPEHKSGRGKCDFEDVPYCPKCEVEPNSHGFPVDENNFPLPVG